MYKLLVRLIMIVAVVKLGLMTRGSFTPRDIQKASREVLRVDWKPISIFPEQAKKFQHR